MIGLVVFYIDGLAAFILFDDDMMMMIANIKRKSQSILFSESKTMQTLDYTLG